MIDKNKAPSPSEPGLLLNISDKQTYNVKVSPTCINNIFKKKN